MSKRHRQQGTVDASLARQEVVEDLLLWRRDQPAEHIVLALPEPLRIRGDDRAWWHEMATLWGPRWAMKLTYSTDAREPHYRIDAVRMD